MSRRVCTPAATIVAWHQHDLTHRPEQLTRAPEPQPVRMATTPAWTGSHLATSRYRHDWLLATDARTLTQPAGPCQHCGTAHDHRRTSRRPASRRHRAPALHRRRKQDPVTGQAKTMQREPSGTAPGGIPKQVTRP